MNLFAAFGAGLVFGIGLILSGMTDPGKVIGFLDVFGRWDPSLAFVMGGAVLVGSFAFRFAHRRTRAFFGAAMHLPGNRDIDNRLVLGSLVFGIGWGLAGYCPGPVLVGAAGGAWTALAFVPAMLAGAWLQRAGRDDAAWRVAFLVGLMGAGAVALHVADRVATSPAPLAMLVVAGLLVGYGTRLGGGCTSGHGVCGVGRMSMRSIVATCVFVASAMATVFVLRHVLAAP